MKPFIFRCTRVSHEEKRTLTIQGEKLDNSVSIHLDLAKLNETDTTFGYIVVNLSLDEYNASKYEVGKEYSLVECPSCNCLANGNPDPHAHSITCPFFIGSELI